MSPLNPPLVLALSMMLACGGQSESETTQANPTEAEQAAPSAEEGAARERLAWATSGSLEGHVFDAGAEIRTGTSGLHIAFQNGAEFAANPNSLLRVTDEAPGQVIMANGWVVVTAGPARIATTRGTMIVSSGASGASGASGVAWAFVVGDQVWFGVLEGTAEVQRADGVVITLGPRQMLSDTTTSPEDGPADLEEWISQRPSAQHPTTEDSSERVVIAAALIQLDEAVRMAESGPDETSRSRLLLAYERARASALASDASPDPVAQRRPRIRRALGL